MKWLWVVVAFVCVGFLGCSKKEYSKGGKKPTTIHLYSQADLISLDPRIGFDRRSIQIIRELFEGLMRIGKDGKPELALAQSVDISQDGKVYTFHLRPSTWSNGRPVTADDFVWAWKSLLNHDVSSTGSYALFVIHNARQAYRHECSLDEVGLRVIDPMVLEVTLEHPAPYFLEFLTLPIYSPICRSAAEADPNWAAGISPAYVCNGPFILKDRKLKSYLTLEKNPLYWNPHGAASDQLQVAIVEDPQTAYNMFCEGSLDWYGDTCGNMTLEMVYDLNKKGSLIKKESGGAYMLPCRTDAPHLASAKIRQALACAIDRKQICEKLLQGGETPAYSLVHRTISLLHHQTFDYDPGSAKKLMAEGMAELGYTKATYPPIVITHFSEPTVKSIVSTIQQQLQDCLGITVELQAVDWGTWMKKFSTGDYQILSLFWFTWYQDPTYNLEFVKYKNMGLNGTGWENPEYIRLLDAADRSVDTVVRNEYLRQAEELVMKELPVIPVFYHTFKYTKTPNLTGEALSASGQMEWKWLTAQ
jgi:oligopeptide transport system substrate-binding protein